MTTMPPASPMMPANGQDTVWLRKPDSKRRLTNLVLGARIHQAWLTQKISVTQIRLQGPLAQALIDLQEATRKSREKYLPIVRLKAALMSSLQGVVRLDRDLGLREAGAPAFEIRCDSIQDGDSNGEDEGEQGTLVRDIVLGVFKRWNMDVLLAWAQRNGVGDIASRVGAAINASGLSIVQVNIPLTEMAQDGAVRKTQFDLIARQIANRLTGEVLFDGLGPCDIVADPTSRSGVVELMTAPTKVAGSDAVFSMVAQLSVFTLPYSTEIYLRASTSKRVWTSKVPGRKPNAPSRVSCYIMAPNKPFLLVSARCPAKEWEFGDDYQQYLMESKGKLPASLAQAVANTIPDDSGWWFGMPKLTTLFDKVGGRTTFECDESDLFDKVMALLPDVVSSKIEHREVKAGGKSPSSEVAMLKVGDLAAPAQVMNNAVAGASLLEPDEEEMGDVDGAFDALTTTKKRALQIEQHRKANMLAIDRVHAGQTPVLWVFGASERERELISACTKELFGESIRPVFEVLPQGVHGLRNELDAPEGKGVERFDARLLHWEHVIKQIPRDEGPRYALICAPKEINGRSEDPVNYFAAIHAMCSMLDANVHYILPIEIDRKSQKPDEQHFVYRLQSALLDVFMAHSGVVLGTQAFVASRLPAPLPQAIYGIQAVRSRAKSFTSESSVSFLIFTRLLVASGTTEIRFAYSAKGKSQRTAWTPLNEGLRWLGSQRQITSDETWIKRSFTGEVKTVVRELAQSDPRAVILVDWATVSGLWPGINDSNLVAGATPRVMLDGVNLASAYPQMTFVRLRSNGGSHSATVSLRKRTTMLYEAWKNEPTLAATGDVIEESYVATPRTLVELNAPPTQTQAAAGQRHYLMVMTYRTTVQILRGMSCYRTQYRMKPLSTDGKDDTKGKRYKWEAISPSKEDAALPASLEVTVLACPSDTPPDDIARLVMGLRLGYAHYADWTKLPAPLSFARKVSDYIIRYPGHAADAPEPDDTDPPSNDTEPVQGQLFDSYLENVQKAVLGESAMDSTAGTDTSSNGNIDVAECAQTVELSPTADAGPEAQDQDSTAAPHSEGEELKPSNPLLARAWALARATDNVYSRNSSPLCRRLYEDMLCGNVRIMVELPWFMTRKTIVPENAWPDSRAIKRFWQTQGDLGFRKPKGAAPSTAGFPEWLMNRMRIPQALYSINTNGLFPVDSGVFYRAIKFFKDYRATLESSDDVFPDPETESREKYEKIAHWMTENGSDADIAWTLMMLAHSCLDMHAETLIVSMDAKELGPMTEGALHFFIDSHEAVSQALRLRQEGVKKIPDDVRRAMPAPTYALDAIPESTQVEHGTLEPQVLSLDADESRSKWQESLVTQISHSAPNMPRNVTVQAMYQQSFFACAGAAEGLAPAGQTAGNAPGDLDCLLRLTASLKPGQADFESVRESVEAELGRLTKLHVQRLQAIEDAQQQALSRQRLIDRLAQMMMRAGKALKRITPECLPKDVDAFEVVSNTQANAFLDDDSLAAFDVSIGDIEGAVDATLQALTRIEDVEHSHAPELQGLTGIDRTRRSFTLMTVALSELDEAQKHLHDRLCACPIFHSLHTPENAVDADLAAHPRENRRAKNEQPAQEPAAGLQAVEEPTTDIGVPDPIAFETSTQQPQPLDMAEQGVTTGAEPVTAAPAQVQPVQEQQAQARTAPFPEPFTIAQASTAAKHSSALVKAIEAIEAIETIEADDHYEQVPLDDRGFDADTASEHPDPQGMLKTLDRTVRARHWALSEAAIQGLRALIPGEPLGMHTTAWSSMLRVLSDLSARRQVQTRLSPALQDYLDAGGVSDSSPASQGVPCCTLASTIGLVGAGLFAMLFEGHEGAARWAVLVQARPRLSEHKPLLDLVERLASLNSTSLMLSRETISAGRVGVATSLNAEIARQRERAASWMSDASIYTKWMVSDYVDMHRAMFDDQHGLGKCLALIARGADESARKLLPEVRKYVEKSNSTLSDLRKRIKRRREFEGPARDHLASNLEITANFIENFFDLLDRSQRESNSNLPKNLFQFLIHLHTDLQSALDYVQDLSFAHAVEQIHRDLTAEILTSALRMMDDKVYPVGLADEEQLLLLQLPLDAQLRPSFGVRLDPEHEAVAALIDPWAVFSEIEAIEDELAQRQAIPGSKALIDLLERAAQGHRDSGRLMPARAIEQRLPRAVASPVHTANEAAQRKQRDLFTDVLNDAKQRTMNAMSLGALAETEASCMLKAIEALVDANENQLIGSPSNLLTPYTDYPHARALLLHHVSQPLAGRIQQSRERLQDDISSFIEKTTKENPDPQTYARLLEKIQRIRQMFEDGSPLGIRVAYNAFSLLREDRLPLLRLDEVNTTRDYEAFQAAFKASGAGNRPFERLAETLRQPAGPTEMKWLSRLSAEQRQDAWEFTSHWIALCAARQTDDLSGPLTAFFRALGTAESPTPIPGHGQTNRLAFVLPAKTFLGSDRSGSGAFIPPSLGSAANHLQGFVLKHHPSTETFGQVITEFAQSTPTFVLARPSLTLAKRSAISRDRPVILIDDDLVAYLALHPEERVSKLMEIGLLTFNTNPYDDYGGRPVPPEMFFGRKAELKLLRSVKSAAVLYGGRRLGKSSLLDQIENDSRQQLKMRGAQDQGEMAIYIPLETRLDTASFGENHRLFAWKTIYNGLVKAKFIEGAKGELNTPEDIRNWISSEVVSGRAATNACYLLIDEADEVMREDLNGGALFVTGLQALCEQVRTHCQMRYVIAGLHNLTRMTTDGNSVLGKAESIALQPFSTSADNIQNGIELITRPLAALGFYFPKGSENLPLRIMALCNFYPAFIQLYCKNLVTRLYNKRGVTAPPTLVQTTDLDAVERDDEFLREMQKKFELNLDLDKRYKAIALILADVYHENSKQGVSLGLTTTEIRDHCQIYTPEHFQQTNGTAYEALLEEMEKLTVLERNGNRFRLRTPHIATMLGTSDRIQRKLEELASETPTENRIPGESRLIIRQNHLEKVFPMSSAWVRNLMREANTDLIVLVGNQLSGLHAIEKLQKEWELGQDAAYEVKLFSSPDNARAYLQRIRRLISNAPTKRLVALPPRSWCPAEIDGYAALAGSLSSKGAAPEPTQRQRLASIRLALIASTEMAWELAQQLHGAAGALPKKGWRIEPVPTWGDDAVFYRLEQHQNVSVRDNSPARQALLDATCGFGSELDRLCTGSLSQEMALKAVQDAQVHLAPNLSTFYAKVGLPHTFTREDLQKIEELLLLIDGERRANDDVQEMISSSGIGKAEFEFFQWMGLLQMRSDGTWHVPLLYKNLLEQPPQ